MSILDEKYDRHEYMGKQLRMFIAYQVRLMRLQRKWTQAELAKRCNTVQSAIARLEDWDAQFPTVNTLHAIAEAFDCALMVKFYGWEGLIAELIPSYTEESAPAEIKP
jgi:transcriptional regulator with XRE-family HTH domain